MVRSLVLKNFLKNEKNICNSKKCVLVYEQSFSELKRKTTKGEEQDSDFQKLTGSRCHRLRAPDSGED